MEATNVFDVLLDGPAVRHHGSYGACGRSRRTATLHAMNYEVSVGRGGMFEPRNAA
jgi:hypothetical protein